MDFQNVSLVQTCEICETICDQSEIENHSCLEGYAQYTTDPQTFYFYPVLDDGVTIIRKSKMPNNEEQVVATRLQEKKTNSITSRRREVLSEVQNASKRRQRISNEGIRAKLNHDDEETLTLEVQSREPLWNYKFPLPQRNIRIVKNLWQEVADALDGNITADEAKFKSLHDTYRRIMKSETCASGSARKNSGKQWAHYVSMEFMRDSCLLKTTVSNIEDPMNNNLEDNGESVENIESNHGSRNKKRRNDSNTCTSAIERIANALCDNNDVMPDLSPPPVLDEIDSFLSMLGCQLRELESRKRREIMRKILNITYDTLTEQY